MTHSDSEEDEDLKRALALSLETAEHEAGRPLTTNDTIPVQKMAPISTHSSTSSTTTALAGLDRKAMEAERLERLARKRQRSISPPVSTRSPRKAPKLEESTVSLPSGAVLKSFSTMINQTQLDRKSPAANAANQRLKAPTSTPTIRDEPHGDEPRQPTQKVLQYPNGVVKKTWAFGYERTGNEIKLEEVLEPLTLRTAVLSAFQWDMEWVLSKIKTPQRGGTTKCIFIMQGDTPELRQEMLEQTAAAHAWLRLCFPPMYQPIHCMHSKLMLLFHPEKLRIAIPSANLLTFDWGETGVMENSVFIIDLPRLPDGGKAEADELPLFAQELLYFLRRQQLDRDVRDGLLSFDFTATEGMMFVHTVGGSHFDDEAERTGLPGLARAVRQLGLESQDGLQVDFAASSIGSLNDDFLKTVHAAARGEDMIARAETATTTTKPKADFFKPSTTTTPQPRTGAAQDIRDLLRIYFPTHNTVTASKAGSAGTICLNRKWFESEKFPRTCFRDYRSTRTGLLSHNKILYARGKKKAIQESDRAGADVAWAYVGSANMSESAWGKVSFDKKTKKGFKVVCRNWECGVLLPVSAATLAKYRGKDEDVAVKKEEREPGDDSETESEDEGGKSVGKPAGAGTDDVVGFEVFRDVIEPPFEVPGPRYGGQDPWYFMERTW